MTAFTAAIPIFFGTARQLFGWYHPAHFAAARGCGIVLCPPVGHEYVASYRAFRRMAEQLAAVGFAVLRLDYYGTGNSVGGPDDTDLVKLWTESIHSAIDDLRTRTGQDRIALLGLRMGASLATIAAAERDDIDALALWSPCVSGKSYIRQIKMLGMTTESTDSVTASDGSIEAAGFKFSSETAATLSHMNLLQVNPKTSRALIVSRDDLPADLAFAEYLRQHGIDVTEHAFQGYNTFMTAPIKSVLPTAALDDIIQWFDTAYPSAPTPHTNPLAVQPSTETRVQRDFDTIAEMAMRFGHGLFGILTTPRIPSHHTKPVIVFLNTGGDHHIGPHRLYAPLAREWAEQGFSVFRFDMAGIGDSPARAGEEEGLAYPPHAIEDVREAVSHVQRMLGARRVVVVGVCSGAYYAIHAAHQGVPMDALIAVNPPLLYWRPGDDLEDDPFWNEYETNRVGRALVTPSMWLRLLQGDVDFNYTTSLLLGRAKILAQQSLVTLRRLITRQSSDASDDISHLFQEHVETSLVFSSDDPGLAFFHRNGGRALQRLRERENFSLEIIEGADHTFMPLRWQRRLVDLLTAHVIEQYQ